MVPGASRTAYDYFMVMFPKDQLVLMVRIASIKLLARGALHTTAAEVLEFIGVAVPATRYELCSLADLGRRRPVTSTCTIQPLTAEQPLSLSVGHPVVLPGLQRACRWQGSP